ncbi:hypothetical protein VDG1235_1211 [Verrucomicrobiia bacterium DG1235]|nr:hypothetical protein VDG1235_1211 [Verrucomicrobiae bacterium DG1235]
MTPRLKSLLLAPFFFASFALADDGENVSPLVAAEAEPEAEKASAPIAPSVGTKSFDAETVNELFAEYKEENKRRAEEMAPHMNMDNLEVIELGPINAQAYEVRNLDLLIDRLDPQPRRRLQRLAELDPAAAADLQVTTRSAERFFAGEGDIGKDMNAGSTANVDFRQVGKSVSEALQKAKAAMREKKVTDDQTELPSSE